jgi:DNA-binding SARP family transcriptional activator
VLNGFRLYQGSELAHLSVNGQRVVGFLAVHDKPLRRLYVASCLWLDASESKAAGNLRSTLWRLRADGLPVVETDRSTIRLARGITTDLRDALQTAERILSYDNADTRLGLGPFQADILPHCHDNWVIHERERYRELRLHVLEALCTELTGRGDYAHAVDAGLAAVGAEPLRESAQRVLIETYVAAGNPAAALRQYRSFSQALAVELGLEPSPALRRLFSEVPVP